VPSPALAKALPNRNIEIKARVHSVQRVREVCGTFARFSAREPQTDTYFACPSGRLKLRERGDQPAQLVAYERPDATTPRASDYWLVPVVEPALMKAALAAVLGVRVVVEKDREVFLYRNVRIHVDRVAALGDFLELEAVLGPEDDEREATRLVAELAQRLGVEPADRIECSYSDLLLAKMA
jgi:predicted adenylyl cyclase CyaB